MDQWGVAQCGSDADAEVLFPVGVGVDLSKIRLVMVTHPSIAKGLAGYLSSVTSQWSEFNH